MNRKMPAVHTRIHTTNNICKNYFQKDFLYTFNIKYYKTTTGNDDVPGKWPQTNDTMGQYI
jgi:hypothetical protein